MSFTANLTPDTLTGLRSGVWTEALFIKALRTGKHMGTARHILPPMPWQFIGELSDDDLKAMWAYLGTIPAVRNRVPDPIDPAGAPIQAGAPTQYDGQGGSPEGLFRVVRLFAGRLDRDRPHVVGGSRNAESPERDAPPMCKNYVRNEPASEWAHGL